MLNETNNLASMVLEHLACRVYLFCMMFLPPTDVCLFPTIHASSDAFVQTGSWVFFVGNEKPAKTGRRVLRY